MVRPSPAHLLAALLALLSVVATPMESFGAADSTRSIRAEALFRRALDELAGRTIESRRQALKHLEEASRIDPGRSEIWLAFGRACIDAGQLSRGRSCLERASRLDPDDPGARYLLGQAWKSDWLGSLDRSSLAKADQCFARAAGLAPDWADAWVAFAAVRLALGDPVMAGRAALRAREADSTRGEPLLALGCAAYRMGALGRADSTLRAALPRLPADMARRFSDAGWIAGGRDEGSEASPSSWAVGDPDLTTPENEAELDYRSRLALALLLFSEGNRIHWDFRTELFVRYGPPATIQINPLESPLQFTYRRRTNLHYAPDPLPYPYNVQVWHYPELGIRAELWDQSLTQSFQLPISDDRDLDPRPNPALVASRPDLISLAGGRGVFRAMPPGVSSMPARGQVSRFPGHEGGRLVAQLVAPGEPGDTLWGSCAIAAADGRVIERLSGPLSISACDPTGRRFADFSLEVPAGDYRVDLSVTDARGRRGLVRLSASVEPDSAPLALSDVVLLCGDAATLGGGVVRLEPDLDHRVSGARALVLYFEIDHLAAGEDGLSRFAYRYTVRPAEPRKKKVPEVALEASREESHMGPVRRQFVSVPVRSLKRGPYDLEVEVRDLVSKASARGEVRFVKE